MLRILIAIETNPHGQPLDNFDEVAAGILWWKEAEQGSGGAWEIFDGSPVIATERIHVDAHGLTRAHVLELSLLEICRHPDIINRNDSKQTLARLNPVAEFDSLAARRIYRQFVYGLSRIGKMQVFTSSGAGTWGPPLRLGSNPEIVMLRFE